MIVDQAHGLHEGMHRGRPDEPPAQFLEVLGQPKRFLRYGHGPAFDALRVRLVAPDESGQRAFALHQLARATRVVDDGLYLPAVAHDAGVAEQTFHVARVETRELVELEITEGGAEVVALGEDGPPAQARLEPFEAQLFEQPTIVGYREAPLRVVIRREFRRGAAPEAARLAVLSN